MKKLATILTAAAMLFTFTALAGIRINDEVPAKVHKAFEKQFANVQNVTWEKGDALYFASFTWHSSEVKAAFNEEGDMLSISRNINTTELPLDVVLNVDRKYPGFKVGDTAVEIFSDNQTTYRFSITNGIKNLTVSANAIGDIADDSK